MRTRARECCALWHKSGTSWRTDCVSLAIPLSATVPSPASAGGQHPEPLAHTKAPSSTLSPPWGTNSPVTKLAIVAPVIHWGQAGGSLWPTAHCASLSPPRVPPAPTCAGGGHQGHQEGTAAPPGLSGLLSASAGVTPGCHPVPMAVVAVPKQLHGAGVVNPKGRGVPAPPWRAPSGVIAGLAQAG